MTMLRLTGRRRQALGATVRELANYGAAALVFGQFVGERGVSWRLIAFGVPVLGCVRRHGAGDRGRIAMENALLMLFGILTVVWIVVGLDWWSRRRERQARDRAA